jgi:hypothetical protein
MSESHGNEELARANHALAAAGCDGAAVVAG